MSVENEDGSSSTDVYGSIDDSRKKPKILYTRDFLLSLSELEICKKLPSGFDQSLLSEFEDASHGIQDRLRGYSSSPFRRSDYSSSPPTRGDSSNLSRGIYGRWDGRGSGWSDKDSDSQSDLDSDSGRRTYGNQSRRSWQSSEHDGLLGCGSFPRPAGYTAGTSAPKGQTNGHYQLNRSNLPYHPPRPFKAVPNSGTTSNDLFNDETFGSSECTSQDKAEEEKKRRASFELMRKEQQKVLQEKQKLNANKHKSDCFSDLMLEDAKEKELLKTKGELHSANLSFSNNDSGKASYPSQSSTSRPLVPPGFRSTVLEKNSTAKPLVSSNEQEGTTAPKGTLDDQGDIRLVDILDMMEQHPKDENSCGLKMGEAIMSLPSGSEVLTEKLGTDEHHSYKVSGLPELHEAVDGEVFELTSNKVMGNKIVSNSSQDSMSSILGKLLGSAPTTKNGSSTSSIEQHEAKLDDSSSICDAQSSKFAQWFHKDEEKPMDNLSSGMPNDLLSLIVGGEKTGPQDPNIVSTKHTPQELSYKGLHHTKNITSTIPSESEQLYNNYRQEAAPPVAAVLTCEDLEQTILSEYNEKSSILQPPVPQWSISGQENMDAKAVDNHATHHLLSLLQRGTSVEDMIPSNINTGPSEKHPPSNKGGVSHTFDKPKDANAESCNSGPNLTLETLLGTAFMKELKSAEAPVSLQRGSAGSARTEAVIDDGLESNRTVSESDLLASKQKQPPVSDKVESWLQFDGPRVDVSKLLKQAGDGSDIQLPEEEGLFAVGDSVTSSSVFAPAGNTTKGGLLPSDATFEIAEKLAALDSGFRGELAMAAQEGPHFVRGPYDPLDPGRQFNSLHTQASSPQMRAAQMTHNQTMFHPLDPRPVHTNAQMSFPEHLTQHDTPPNHQFPANMLHPPHHADTRVTGFDIPANPQMQMPGNFAHHLLRDFPRPSLVPRPSNQAINFMPHAEAMHGFIGHRQHNIRGLGMPLPASDPSSGTKHPEAFQRIMEMELRAQSKQIRPFGAGYSQGMYGHELDIGFRYR